MSTATEWTLQEQWSRWFATIASRFAASRGLLPPSVDFENAILDDAWLALLSDFITDRGSLKHYDTPQAAAEAFKKWTMTKSAIRPTEAQGITCQVTKNFGGVTVTFGWTGTFDISSPQQIQPAYEYAMSVVNAQFAWYVQTELPKTSAPTSGNQTELPSVFTSSHISRENRGGTDFYKIKGGEFSKWGIRVWPEVLQEAGVNLDALDFGDNPFSRTCYFIRTGDNHAKVTRIE